MKSIVQVLFIFAQGPIIGLKILKYTKLKLGSLISLKP